MFKGYDVIIIKKKTDTLPTFYYSISTSSVFISYVIINSVGPHLYTPYDSTTWTIVHVARDGKTET